MSAAMQDPFDPSSKSRAGSDPRRTAALLSATLADLSLEAFTWRQHALFSDAAGLLEGLAQGVLPCGQRRLRDDLLELVALFDVRPEGQAAHARDVERIPAVAEQLLSLIGGLAASGLSVEGFPLNPLQSKVGSDRQR